mgnify:CR=1 FL=1|jgi:hypothetical protein|tara:strand:- start:1993 stop:2199 length:207 start_codon:yes stop_codon:yes gene_type:complete
MHFFGKHINHFQRQVNMWEPAAAMAFSIFLTVSLFLIVYGLAFLGVMLLIKAIKSIKQQISDRGTNEK